MKQTITRILAQYGSTVTLRGTDGEKTIRAFVQPVTAKSEEAMRRYIETLGELPRGKFIYIGPVETPAHADDTLVCQGRAFRVCRAETLMLGDEALYIWGLLREEGGEEPWTS